MCMPHVPAAGEADHLPVLLVVSLSWKQVPPLRTGPDNEAPCQTSWGVHSYPNWPTRTSHAWGDAPPAAHPCSPRKQERRLVGTIDQIHQCVEMDLLESSFVERAL